MLEIEIKAYCDDLARVRATVIDRGGRFVRDSVERDIYFNHPARDFGATDEALRIRAVDGRFVLTCKGPKIGERAKSRYEREVVIDDADGMEEILVRLGFSVTDRVEKRRSVYQLGDVEVCFDDVAGAGTFVELERKGTERIAIEDELFRLAAELGLERFERRSYLDLVMERRAT
ncbi:MAG TPA: class IV adenylate cyclase [Spirochaetota bacterium]|nr:class IV adenylate cyclase [Spirochaetota bacterium]